MKAITDINEVHHILLNIAKEFDRICRENNINYWMLGGTQLGAVRHHGFIPWDDDMDFGVMQKDFPRMMKCMEQQLPVFYRCRTRYNCSTQFGNTLKIEDTRTIINLNNNEYDEEKHMGINIDVFPLNYTNGSKSFFSKNWWISLLLKLQFFRFCDYSKAGGQKAFVSRLCKILFVWLRLNQITDFINKHLISDKGDHIVNYWGRWIMKEIVSKSVMGNPIRYQFENTTFLGVANSHLYLKSLYGDYMAPPSKNRLNRHLTDVFWK